MTLVGLFVAWLVFRIIEKAIGGYILVGIILLILFGIGYSIYASGAGVAICLVLVLVVCYVLIVNKISGKLLSSPKKNTEEDATKSESLAKDI